MGKDLVDSKYSMAAAETAAEIGVNPTARFPLVRQTPLRGQCAAGRNWRADIAAANGGTL